MAVIQQTGYKLPQAVISNGFTTGNEWSNPENLLLVDGEFASSTSAGASDVIVGNFDFNLPEGSVITGIQFQVIGYVASITSPLTTLSPSAVDNTSGSNLYYPYITPLSGMTTSVATYTLGTSSYLFATSWTVDQINNFKLQLEANETMYIDAVLVNVYYYDGTSPEPDETVDGLCVSCESQIQAQPFSTALPVTGTDTGIYVKSFNTPDGVPITMSDVGECGGNIPIVMDQGKPSLNGSPFEENALVIDIVPQPNGTVFLDFGSLTNRGRGFVQPYTHSSDLISEHNANSEVVISNSGIFYDKFLKKCQIDVLVSPPITVQDEGAPITTSLHTLNFQGAGVVAQIDPSDSHKVNVTVAGGGGTTPPVVVTTSSSGTGNVQALTLTWEHTSVGINRGLLVQVETEQSKTISSVTFNGVALTQVVVDTDTPANLRNEQWFLVAPPAGTFNIVVTMSAPAYITAGAESLVNVDQTTPTGTAGTNDGVSNNPSVTISTMFDNSVVIDGVSTALTPILYTKGENQVENWHITANGNTRQGGSSYQSAGTSPDSVIMEWDLTQTTDWLITAIEIKGITIPGGGGGDVDITVTQVANGFAEGDVLRSNGTDNTYAKAIATNGVNAEVVGIVKQVIDPDSFILSKDAYYSGAQVPSGTPGNAVFLSDVTAGLITLTEPTTPGRISKPIGVLLASGTLMSFSADIRGNVVAAAGGSGVQSVTGLDTDNTDPQNPVVGIAVDGVTIQGLGTPGSPLIAIGGGGFGSGGGTKLSIDTDQRTLTTSDLDIMDFTVPGGTLGSNNAIRFKIWISDFQFNSSDVLFKFDYGGSTLVTAALDSGTLLDSGWSGWLEGVIVADNDNQSQKISFTVTLVNPEEDQWDENFGSSTVGIGKIMAWGNGTSSVDSSIDQQIAINVQFITPNVSNNITSQYWIAEKVTSGGGNQIVSEQNIGGFQTSSSETTYYGYGATSSVDGNRLYMKVNNEVATDNAYMYMYERDTNSGLYYLKEVGVSPDSLATLFTGGLATDETYVYFFYSGASNSHACKRADAADLANEVAMTFNDGVVPIASGVFFDGTFFYLYVGGGTWKKYSRSGTAFTFVANLTGGSIGEVAFFDQDTGHMLAFKNSGQILEEYSFNSSTFTLLSSKTYEMPVLLGQSQQVVGITAVSGASPMVYLPFGTRMDMGSNLRYNGGILKAFTKPSEL